jgi:hypothetical protein
MISMTPTPFSTLSKQFNGVFLVHVYRDGHELLPTSSRPSNQQFTEISHQAEDLSGFHWFAFPTIIFRFAQDSFVCVPETSFSRQGIRRDLVDYWGFAMIRK